MRWLAVLLGLIGFVGCVRTREAPAPPLRVVVRVPIDEELRSPGAQARLLPWDTRTLEAEVRYDLEDGQGNALEPLEAGLARLGARAEARRILARRMARLPAAEPPPGRTSRLTLGEFADGRDTVRAAIETALADGWEESVGIGEGGEALLTLGLELRPVAAAVLLAGGGFRESTEVEGMEGARARARNAAMEQAREQLMERLRREEVREGMTFGDWAGQAPAFANALAEYVRQARVIRSEAVASRDGEGVWVTVLEADLAPLREAVLQVQAETETAVEEARRENP